MRFVINVPKSLDKRSTKRNHTKRIIEQVILQIHKELKRSKQILIRAKEIITNVNRAKIEQEFINILKDEFSN